MVIKLLSNKNERTVDIKLNIQELETVIAGVNRLVVHKEEEMNKYNGGDPQDKEQYLRYKTTLSDLQQAKKMIK